jgi:hypothetical protein
MIDALAEGEGIAVAMLKAPLGDDMLRRVWHEGGAAAKKIYTDDERN